MLLEFSTTSSLLNTVYILWEPRGVVNEHIRNDGVERTRYNHPRPLLPACTDLSDSANS